jgi:hypothetical protein
MNAPAPAATQSKLLSAHKTRERLDLCPTTLWKLEKKGLLEGVTVFSKKYYTVASIERFEDRALAGEFARAPRGAAAWPTKQARAKGKGNDERQRRQQWGKRR